MRQSSPVSAALLVLFGLELAAVTALFGLYKLPAYDAGHMLSVTGGVVAAGALLGLACLAALVRLAARDVRAAGLAAAVNVVAVAVPLLLAEGVLRALRQDTPAGPIVAGVHLRPGWDELARNSRALLDSDHAYFVYDAELGWVVGRSRSGAGGLYLSSAEGLRSARQGVSYADVPSGDRIALVGDSNAFSLEVSFEDSWGHQLGERLRAGTQVLNFGVDGYGIDQVYLRYLRDVRPWHPRVVFVGFVKHDLLRSMTVYPVVSLGWPGYLVKPRFDLRDGRLVQVNAPLPPPDRILAAPRPADLPGIEYDDEYQRQDWDWRFEHGPLLLRLVTTVSPRWPEPALRSRADTVTLNARLLVALHDAIRSDGAEPFLVYFPRPDGDDALAHETLRSTGLPYLDLTDCLARVPPGERRVPSQHHLTGAGNRAVAECTAPLARNSLVP